MDYGVNAKALIELRNWADSHLPTYGSLICYDLGLHVIRGTSADEPVGLKQLYRALPYSEAHLRRQLRRFEDDRWIMSKPHPGDARNRFIEPTERMLDAYRQYFHLCVAAAERITANSDHATGAS